MEADRPHESRDEEEREFEKTDDSRRDIDDQGGESASEQAEQTSVEPPGDDPLALPDEPRVIAELLRDEPGEPGELEPSEDFLPLAEITDPANPVVSLEALDQLEARSSDALPTGDSPVDFSEAEVEKLVQDIAAEMEAQPAPETASPEGPAGVLLRPDVGADSESQHTPVAREDSQQPTASPRGDKPAQPGARSGVLRHPQTGRRETLAPAPRVVVSVQLADARRIMEEERGATAKEMATLLEQIADARIDRAERTKERFRRAADHRLRR